MSLIIRGNEPRSAFGLGKVDENSATFALGWVLEHSPYLRQMFLRQIFNCAFTTDSTVLTLQKHGKDDGGYTDMEIQSGLSFHAILEAKRWWNPPEMQQLQNYLSRLVSSNAEHKCIVTVSAADRAFAQTRLGAEIAGVSIKHLSWSDLRKISRDARATASTLEEKFWLRQLILHLEEFVWMERLNNNKAFVVALSAKAMPERTQTWIDVVEQNECYFHPVGNRWPVQPPNYIGFRYRGKLQSVHHIDAFKIVKNVSECNPEWPDTDGDHFVYKLGPAMRPHQEIRTGNIWGSGWAWCAIDTLLSGAFSTISEARDETQRRQEEEQ